MILRSLALSAALILISGCSTLISEHGGRPIERDGQFAVVPFINLSQTPQAGDQAASIVTAILRANGVVDVRLYLPEDDNPLMYESQARQAEAIARAEAEGADLIVTGTVEEWRYKSGLDGEPAIGVTLLVRETGEEELLWSGTAARTGWGREGLGIVGREVLQDLVEAMPLTAVAR